MNGKEKKINFSNFIIIITMVIKKPPDDIIKKDSLT